MSRSTRSALNFLTSSFAAAVIVGLGFVVAPLLLRWLGADRLGAYRVSIDWLGYLTLLELGTGAALAPLILEAQAGGNETQRRAVLAAGWRRYFIVATLSLVVGAGLVAALPTVTNTPRGLWNELWIGAGLYLVIVNLSFPLTVYRPLAEASQKGYLVSALMTVQGITVAGLGVAAAAAGMGLVGQFLATTAGILVVTFGLAALQQRSAPLGRLIRPHTDLTQSSARLRTLSRHSLIQALIGRICLMTDNIIVGLFLGPVAVTAFAYTQSLAKVANVVLQSAGNATWAGLAELHQIGQHDLFRQRLREMTKLTAALGGVFVVPLAALTRPFMDLWMGQEQYAGDGVAALAVLNTVLLPVYGLWGWVYNGTGRVHRLIPYLVVIAVINLSVSVFGTWGLGIVGPLLGTSVTLVTYAPWKLTRLMRDDFGMARGQMLWATVYPLLPAVALLTLGFALRETWPNYHWVRLAIEYSAMAALNIVAVWFLVLDRNERQMCRHLVVQFRQKLRQRSRSKVEGM